jgi:PKD repeat protein
LKKVWHSVLSLIAAFAVASPSLAQNHPLPYKAGQTATVCTTCGGNNEAGEPNAGKPTYPYGGPLTGFVGRIVDSSSTIAIQHAGMRTVRASEVVRTAFDTRGSAPPRIYYQLGETVAAYSLNNFFTTTLSAPLVPLNQINTGSSYLFRTALERIQMVHGYLYPESNKSGGWKVPLVDGQSRLGDFDFDDRGYLYAAYQEFGWGIVKDNGETNGAHLAKVLQVLGDEPPGLASTNITPRVVISLKSGARYYAVISNSFSPTKTAIYDVTNPSAPQNPRVRNGAENGISTWDKSDDAGLLAVLNGDGKVRIYDYDSYVVGTGPAPLETVSASSGKYLRSPSFDDQGNLYILEGDIRGASNNVLWKLRRNGSGFTKTALSPYPGAFNAKFMHAANGYVAIGGENMVNGKLGADLLLFKVEGSNLRQLDTDHFFRRFYHAAPTGYAQPDFSTPKAVRIFKQGTKTYLMYNSHGLGDVYQLGNDGPQLSVTMKTASFGTPNPFAQPTQAGPFPGDIVTFSASVTPSATHSLTWNFGNTEAGAAANVRSGSTGVDIQHQFTGLNNLSKVQAAKSVSATSTTDSEMTDTATVNLKTPEARIAIKATGELVTASGFEVVAGDKFVDASDGSIESHVANWTIGGSPTLARPNEEISVGALGSRSVELTSAYGKYDSGALANPAGSYNATVSAKTYEVKPFIVKLKPAVRTGTGVTYSATARHTTDTSILSATTWTVTWSLKTGAVETAAQTNTVAVGTIPNFPFDKSLLVNNSTVKLTVSVDPTSVPAPSFATYIATEEVKVPDPVIQLTNCGHVNDNCSIKAISGLGNATSSWQLSWVVKRGTSTVASGTGNPLTTFKLTQAGSYTATVTETIFDTTPVTLGFEVAESLCGQPPQSHQLAITASCTTNCAANSVITFDASTFQYTPQECDIYTWNFGDGSPVQSGAGLRSVQHAYTSDGQRTVTLNVKNSSNSTGTNATTKVTVGSGGNNGGGGTTCTAPTNINFTYSNASGCSANGNCRTGQAINFSATRNGSSLLNCDNATWDFGDGGTSTSKSPSRTYTTPGTYTVKLKVQNTAGTAPEITKSITIIQGPTGSCGVGPNATQAAMTYTGRETGCTKTNGVACKAGELVDFFVSFFQYVKQPCDQFQWTFGDGTTANTDQPSHAFPTGINSATVSVKIFNTTSPNGLTLTTPVALGPAAPIKPQPVLTFPSFPTSVSKGTPVTFTVNSNIEATAWTFTFGDGSSDSTTLANHRGTTATIQHTYTTAGTYTVTVQAGNAEDVARKGLVVGTGLIVVDIPEYKFLLPVVTHAGGANNSVWRTDVQIYTPQPGVSPQNPLHMTAQLRDITRPLEVFNPTFTYEDFMRVFTNAADSGPVIITVRAQQPPQIWTRTYNQTDAGTFGQFIPAIRIDAAAGAGSAFGTGKYYMAGLRHDGRFRTNLGFVNPNPNVVNATVKVYDDKHFILGSFPLQLQPYQLDQFPITADKAVKNLPADRPFSVQIEVPPGQWLIGYASYIDSNSNDPCFIQAIRESELSLPEYSKGVIPGVGHVGEWRSDVTIFNPDTEHINVDLAYYDQGGTKVAEAKAVPIRAGEFVQYTDFLKQGVLGNVPDSLGILRVTVPEVNAPLKFPMTFARTYNDKGTGKTFGQGIAGFAAGRTNVRAGKPGLVPGVRSNSKYYTNVIVTNPSTTTVTATVKMLDPTTGAETTLHHFTLSPNQTIVGPVNLGTYETASVKIEADGNVWAFCSIVDKGTADPENVPATPMAQ